MGFETFPSAANNPSEDESKRINDVDKAREMAEAGDSARTMAAEKREELKQPWVPSMKEQLQKQSEFLDERAEQREERAAFKYDIEKSMESMSDAEVEAEKDKLLNEEKVARGEWEAAGEEERNANASGRASETPAIREKGQIAKNKYFELYNKRTAIESVLQKRWNKEQ